MILCLNDFYWDYRTKPKYDLKMKPIKQEDVPNGLCYDEYELVCKICDKPIVQKTWWQRALEFLNTGTEYE